MTSPYWRDRCEAAESTLKLANEALARVEQLRASLGKSRGSFGGSGVAGYIRAALAFAPALGFREEKTVDERSGEAPCYDCKTTERDRSPCPLCGKVVCELCAEREGESCCDAEPTPPAPGLEALADEFRHAANAALDTNCVDIAHAFKVAESRVIAFMATHPPARSPSPSPDAVELKTLRAFAEAVCGARETWFREPCASTTDTDYINAVGIACQKLETELAAARLAPPESFFRKACELLGYVNEHEGRCEYASEETVLRCLEGNKRARERELDRAAADETAPPESPELVALKERAEQFYDVVISSMLNMSDPACDRALYILRETAVQYGKAEREAKGGTAQPESPELVALRAFETRVRAANMLSPMGGVANALELLHRDRVEAMAVREAKGGR